MSDLASTIQIVSSVIVSSSAATVIGWRILLPHVRKAVTGRMDLVAEQVGEIHQQTTVNHHTSETPTIKDQIDDLKQLVLRHIEDSEVRNARLDALEEQREREPAGPSFTIRFPRMKGIL